MRQHADVVRAYGQVAHDLPAKASARKLRRNPYNTAHICCLYASVSMATIKCPPTFRTAPGHNTIVHTHIVAAVGVAVRCFVSISALALRTVSDAMRRKCRDGNSRFFFFVVFSAISQHWISRAIKLRKKPFSTLNGMEQLTSRQQQKMY